MHRLAQAHDDRKVRKSHVTRIPGPGASPGVPYFKGDAHNHLQFAGGARKLQDQGCVHMSFPSSAG